MSSLYEIVFIIKPDAVDETIKGIIQKAGTTAEDLKGSIISVDEWGKRRLAYPIQRHQEGYYVLINFSGDASVPKGIERMLRLNENCLRFQTIRQQKAQKPPVPKEAETTVEVKNV
ncbi:MAG: 30S ribosomal protein S6 [Deltaproteobacteria bacterium]|nr:30S ribosomal protein S6 [Deltaproteobacteria bacterium]